MVCPNPNHPDWIALVNKIGEQKAYEAFVRSGEQIPNPDLFPDLNNTLISIKPEVLELFENNPKLANAVYEALGFNNSGLQSFKDKLIDIIGVDKIKELYSGTDIKFDSFIIDDVELGTNKDLIVTIKTNKGQRTAINLRLDGDYQQLKISEGGKTIRGIYAPLSEKQTAIDFLINEFKKVSIDKLTGNLKYPSYNKQKEYYLAKDVNSLLQNIVKFTENADTKLLAETLLKVPNINDILLEVTKYTEKLKGRIEDSPNTLGTYSSTFPQLITVIGNLPKDTFETVFLHELIHGITVKEYYKNKEFSDKINILYNYALKFKDYNTSKGITLGKMYGMKNSREFMSEAMTNPDFIYELSKYYSPTQEKLKKKNIFQEFIDLVVNLIKTKIESKGKKYIENNLGTSVLNTIANYANVNVINFKSISKLENNKIIPQQVLQIYSQYIEQTGKQDIEGFKKFISNKNINVFESQDITFNPQNDKPLSTNTLSKVATKLKEKFNVNFQIVKLRDAEKLYGREIPQGLKSFWKSDTNTVVFIEGRAGYYTAIHEFSHPFVRYIKQANSTIFQGLKGQATSFLKEKYDTTPEQFLLARGYSNRVANGQITEEGWEEIITHAVELTTKAIVDNDGSLENFKPSLINFVVKFWKKVGEMLKSLFPKSNLNPEYIRSITSLNLEDIASFMMDRDSTLDLSYIKTEFPEVFEKLDETTSSAYSQQINDYKSRTGKELTTKQIETLNIIISKQNLKLSDDGKSYTDGVNTLQRVTEYLNSLEGPNDEPSYYIFRGAEDDYADSRERGSQVDDVVQGIIEGLDLDSTINKVHSNAADRKNAKPDIKDVEIGDDLLKTIYNEVKSLLETEYKDHIILSQVQLYDIKSKIAGTADIVLIDRDGKITILDVKSSIKSTLDAAYRRQFTLKETGEKAASSYQRYSAQTSVYKGLAMTMGLKFTDTTYDLGIIPVHFTEINDTGSPEKLDVEPVLNLAAYEYIIDKFVPKDSLTVEDLNLKSKEGRLIEEIKMVLTKRYDQIKNIKRKFFEAKEIQQLIELLDTTEKTKVLNLFIDQVYNMLVSKELPNGKLKPGLSSEIKNISRDLTNNKIDVKEAINRFMVIKQTVEIFGPLIESLNAFKRSDISYMDTVDNPVFNKINHCISALSDINKTYENEVVYYLADILYENGISKKANEDVKREIEFQKKQIEQLKKVDPKKAEKQQQILNKRIMFLRSEEGVTKNVLIKSLKEGSSEDISTIDLYLTSAISSSNELLASFSKTLKNDLENARQELLSFERSAATAFEDYVKSTSVSRNDVAEFNKPFFEEVNVFDKMSPEGEPMFKKEIRFVSNIDYNAYNKVYANYIKLLNQAKTPADRSALRKAFIKNYKKVRPKEDIVIKNPYTRKEAIIVKGLNSLIEDQRKLFERGLISENQLNNYIARAEGRLENNELVFDDEFLMINPEKFRNQKYEALSGATKKYYDFLVSSHFESQEDLPSKLGYRLPAIVKTGLDQLKENGIKDYFMYKWEYFKKRQTEEIQRYGSDIKEIPMIYNIEIDPELVNLDLVSSVIAYRGFSLDYNAKQENLAAGEALLDMVKLNPPTKTDSLGNRYFDSVALKLGIKDEALKYYKNKLGDNNIAKLLAIFIDTQIYGKHNVESVYNIFGKSVDMNKLVDSVMSFAAVTQLGGVNPLPALVNYMQGNIQASIEAFGGQFFSDKEWLQSRVEYDASIIDYLKDFANPVNKSFMGQLIDTIDPMQGEYKDAAGRKISQSAFKKMWSSDTWFFLQHQGEHSVQVRTMIAVLLSTKVKDASGKEISMFKAYQENFKKTGQITLNGYFTDDKLSENGKISRDVQDRLHALNKRMHGIYNSFDKPALERHALGRVLIMYRKFLAPGLKRRYKRLGLDQELGTFTEGYYNTFFSKLRNDTKKLIRFYMGLEKNGFSPHEKQNLRRAAREMMIVFATGLAVIVIASLMEDADDDDEKRVLSRFLFTAMKLNQELGIYLTFGDPQNILLTPNIREFYNNLKGVSAITGTLDRFVKLTQQLSDPTEVYQKDTGIFNKGDSKLLAAFMKFWGITGVNFDPEESIKYMKMKQ